MENNTTTTAREIWVLKGENNGAVVEGKKVHTLPRSQTPAITDFIAHMATYIRNHTASYNPKQTGKRAVRWLRKHGVGVIGNKFSLDGKNYTVSVNNSQPEITITELEG